MQLRDHVGIIMMIILHAHSYMIAMVAKCVRSYMHTVNLYYMLVLQVIGNI